MVPSVKLKLNHIQLRDSSVLAVDQFQSALCLSVVDHILTVHDLIMTFLFQNGFVLNGCISIFIIADSAF